MPQEKGSVEFGKPGHQLVSGERESGGRMQREQCLPDSQAVAQRGTGWPGQEGRQRGAFTKKT